MLKIVSPQKSLPHHTISAGGVVVNPEGKIAVTSQHGASWSLPKGHIDGGEEPLDAARREIMEETGIKALQFVKDLGQYQRYRIGKDGGEDTSEIKTIHMFLFRTDNQELKPRDPENPEALWVEKNRVAQILTHPKDRQFFSKITSNIP